MKNIGFLQMRNIIRTCRNTFPLRAFLSSAPPEKPSTAAASAGSAVADFAGDNEEDDVGLLTTATVKPFAMHNLLQPRVVIFDGVCPLCHSGVKWVIRADKHKKIKFCCLQSQMAEPYMKLCEVEREDVLRRFIFVEGLGQYHQASTAALKVLSYLPFPYSALSSLMIIPVPVRDAVYDYIAKRRYDWFGKEKDCLVLREPEMLERFIDREEILARRQSDM